MPTRGFLIGEVVGDGPWEWRYSSAAAAASCVGLACIMVAAISAPKEATQRARVCGLNDIAQKCRGEARRPVQCFKKKRLRGSNKRSPEVQGGRFKCIRDTLVTRSRLGALTGARLMQPRFRGLNAHRQATGTYKGTLDAASIPRTNAQRQARGTDRGTLDAASSSRTFNRLLTAPLPPPRKDHRLMLTAPLPPPRKDHRLLLIAHLPPPRKDHRLLITLTG